MVPELEKPRVIEIQVRMDCNGCVQKIKKALNGINGIYDLYIDFPQQKITIIGWADPEKIVKAIKKTRKAATVCAHTEQPTDPAAKPTEPTPEGGEPKPDAASPPPAENTAPEAPPTEPPKDPQPPENPPAPEAAPPPAANDQTGGQPSNASKPKDVEEVHVIYHHPPDYRYRYGYGHCHGMHWDNHHPSDQGFRQEPPQPIYVTHSYNTYRPSPFITEYEHIRAPPQNMHYNSMNHYSEDYHNNRSNGNITSMFSDENPNACRIV
ncbi:Heavy metal-associated domain, HMA [Dillenia turbinata]|uniref:Heavy metal-associated domain, HMA n=1 Tax=Dillenia turbinata TaxID=194707 RepID=A0AAN8YY07_9MAGN